MSYLAAPLAAWTVVGKKAKERIVERSILMPGESESTEDVFVCYVCGEPAVEAVKFSNGQVRYYCAECT